MGRRAAAGDPREGLIFLQRLCARFPVGSEVREPDVSPQGEGRLLTPPPSAVQRGEGATPPGQGLARTGRRGLGVPAERCGTRSPIGLGLVGSKACLPWLCPGPTLSPEARQAAAAWPPFPRWHCSCRPAGMAAFPGGRVQVLRAPLYVDSSTAHLYVVSG